MNAPRHWPNGYYPLWHRNDSTRAVVTIAPADTVLDYFTGCPLISDVVSLEPKSGMIRLLAKPGDYTLTSTRSSGTVHAYTVTVIDPLAEIFTKSFRDGKPLWRRPGKSDQFIIGENPYRHLPITGTVLDCGAHIGTFARDALNRGATSVIAYEPDPLNVSLLRRNVEDLPVECHHAAIDAESRDAAPFYLSWTDGGLGSSGNSLYGAFATRPVVNVTVRSLQEVLDETQPNTVKLDIKYAEDRINWFIMRWPKNTEAIALEVDHRTDMNHLAAAMNSHGFNAMNTPKTVWRRPVTVWTR